MKALPELTMLVLLLKRVMGRPVVTCACPGFVCSAKAPLLLAQSRQRGTATICVQCLKLCYRIQAR